MKKTSRNRRQASAFIIRFGLPTLVVVLALVIFSAWRQPIGGFLWKILTPVVEMRNALSGGDVERLRAELEAANARAADRDLLEEEVRHLKRLLGRETSVPIILAGVLQHPPATPYDTLMLDAGSLQGVVLGNVVSAGGSALIGRVSEVYAQSARVTLFSAPGEEHSAFLTLGSGVSIPMVLEGKGAGTLVGQVPAGTDARVGDAVMAPGLLGGFTGRVVAIEAGESESFETLYVRLPANPYALRSVEVWQGSTLTLPL